MAHPRLRAFSAQIVLPLLFLFIASCGTGETPPTEPCVLSTTMAPTSMALEVGESSGAAVAVTQSNCSGVATTWSSSNDATATVSAAGLVTGVASGTATITATTNANDGTTSTATLTVVVAEPAVASVVVTPPTSQIFVGAEVDLTAQTLAAGGAELTGRPVTWSSASTGVATVSAAGRVTGVGVGTTTITATSEGVSGSATVTVELVPVATVAVTPEDPVVPMGETVSLTAATLDADDNELTGRTVTWSSSDPGVASVSSSGLVTAVTVGSATITATSEGVAGTTTVRVTALLLHRWTFDEVGGAGTTLVDEVGGDDATIVDVGANDAFASGGEVVLAGGARADADYVDLGSGLVSGLTDASIELWGRNIGLQNWGRVFDFGSSTSNYLLMTWSVGASAGTDRVEWRGNGLNFNADNTMSPYELGREYHIVLTVDDDGGTSGQTLVRWFKDGVEAGSLETDLDLSDIADTDMWLGRSQYAVDGTANAAYNEVRIYDGVLSDDEILANAGDPPSRNILNVVDGGWRSVAFPDADGWYFTGFGATGWNVPTAPPAGTGRVWDPSGASFIMLRRTMNATSAATSGTLNIQADDYYMLNVNEPSFASSVLAADANYLVRDAYDIQSAWRAGDNFVAVVAADYGGGRYVDVSLDIDGTTGLYNTGAGDYQNWRTTGLDVPRGWQAPGYDDSAWSVAQSPWTNSPLPDEESIWHPDDRDVIVLRREFELDEVPSGATLRISADNIYSVAFGSAQQSIAGADKTWETIDEIDVTSLMVQGTNVIWIVAMDAGVGSGVLVDLRITP